MTSTTTDAAGSSSSVDLRPVYLIALVLAAIFLGGAAIAATMARIWRRRSSNYVRNFMDEVQCRWGRSYLEKDALAYLATNSKENGVSSGNADRRRTGERNGAAAAGAQSATAMTYDVVAGGESAAAKTTAAETGDEATYATAFDGDRAAKAAEATTAKTKSPERQSQASSTQLCVTDL